MESQTPASAVAAPIPCHPRSSAPWESRRRWAPAPGARGHDIDELTPSGGSLRALLTKAGGRQLYEVTEPGNCQGGLVFNQS